LFGASSAAVFRFEQGGSLKYLAGVGVPNRAVRKLEDAANSAWIADLLDKPGQPVVVHADKDHSAQGDGIWADLLDAATMAFAPLHSNGQTLGILVVCHGTPYNYQPQEHDILRVVAALASGVVARLPL